MATRKNAGRRRVGAPPARTRSHRRLLMLGVPLLAIVAIAGVLIAVHLGTSSGPGAPDASNLRYVSNAKSEFAGIPSNGSVVGWASAPVTVQEFGDLRCPVCREFDSTVIPEVLQKLVRTKKVKLLFRHWPILGANSVYADRAAYAAMQQNKLWEFALVTYYNQGDENDAWFTKAFARGVAYAIGLDLAKFDSDLDDTSASKSEIDAANKAAVGYGFKGTPSVLVVGPRKTENLGNITPDYSDIARAVAQVTVAQ